MKEMSTKSHIEISDKTGRSAKLDKSELLVQIFETTDARVHFLDRRQQVRHSIFHYIFYCPLQRVLEFNDDSDHLQSTQERFLFCQLSGRFVHFFMIFKRSSEHAKMVAILLDELEEFLDLLGNLD